MENLLLAQASNKEIKQLTSEKHKLLRSLTVKCFNCDQVGHQKSACTNPKKTKQKKCYVCSQPGHLSKACPLVVVAASGQSNQDSSSSTAGESAPEPIQEVTLLLESYNDCSVTADIDGVDVYCQISTGTTCNIMQQDVWERVSREGSSAPGLDVARRQKLKSALGGYLEPLGRARLPTKYRGVKYDLDWVVVANNQIPVKACLGTPFARHLIIGYSQGHCEIRPAKENPSPDSEEIVLREMQKVKDQVNKRTEAFLREQKKYMEQQVEVIKASVEKKRLENGIKKTIKKIRQNAAA